MSGSVCTDPDVLAAPGVGCWSYGVGILIIGSKECAISSWFPGLGVAARLAICGRGEKEKLGEKGRLRVFMLLLLTLRLEVALGGVKGGCDVCGTLGSCAFESTDDDGPAISVTGG